MISKIDPKHLEGNVFSMIGDQWALLTAGSPEHFNTMTVSWGGLGVLWGKNVATVYVRPQRYTREFMEQYDRFTLSFYGPEWKKALALCGSKSGRDVDKVKECGFTPANENGAPYFEEADLVLCCKKLYWQDMDPTHFLSEEIEKNYPDKDYHRIYIGEIEAALKR